MSPKKCAGAGEGGGASWRCGKIEAWKDGGGVMGPKAGALGQIAVELLGAAVWLLAAVAESLVAVARFPAVAATLAPL